MKTSESERPTDRRPSKCSHTDGAGDTLIEDYEHVSMCASCGEIFLAHDPNVQWSMLP